MERVETKHGEIKDTRRLKDHLHKCCMVDNKVKQLCKANETKGSYFTYCQTKSLLFSSKHRVSLPVSPKLNNESFISPNRELVIRGSNRSNTELQKQNTFIDHPITKHKAFKKNTKLNPLYNLITTYSNSV